MSQTEIDKIIGQVTKKLLMVLLPTIIITVGGMFVRDHFALGNKLDIHTYQENHYRLQLLVEARNKALENIALQNKNDIEHFEADLEEIKRLQEKINERIIKEFGTNRGIPELSTN